MDVCPRAAAHFKKRRLFWESDTIFSKCDEYTRCQKRKDMPGNGHSMAGTWVQNAIVCLEGFKIMQVMLH